MKNCIRMKLLTIMLMAACFPRSSMCFKLLKYPFDNGHFARRISRFISISNEASSTQVDDVNSAVLGNDESGRYNDVLRTVGLDPSIMKSLPTIPDKRVVTPNDVFCNRELKMSGIRAIGFDMDYTLAQYQQPAFDQLAFDGAVEKLVNKLRYPVEVLDFTYDHTHWARGLIIDVQRGNFLKIDRHKYVRVAYHGFDPISSKTRKHLYSRAFNKVVSFSEKNFVNMDTLFQFVDAHLFASLIELKDKGESEFLDFKTYEEIYRDVRESIDLCHRDGYIKDQVAQKPEDYIIFDPNMRPMLQKFKDNGIKVFLLTNSYWEYTSQAMNFLYHGKHVDEVTKKENQWLDLFDIAIVGSCKPQYMLDPYLNLFRVKPEDGSLLNTDGLYEIEALGPDGAGKFLEMGKTFQGGNWKHLQAMLGTQAGEEILYVGDHLYSDVLRSKRTLGWRSAFIMPELEEEMKVFSENADILKSINKLRELRGDIEALTERYHLEEATKVSYQEQINAIKQVDAVLKEKLVHLSEMWHGKFHPIWGAIFNAGYQDSRFAFYVENYACLYTSKATNLGLSSISKSYRTSGEMLPHDKLLVDPTTVYCDVNE